MSPKYEPVIGLEVHVQLTTKTKIFCSCATAFGETPNSRTCPVCLGLPGALPVLNYQAVEYAIRTGLATNCHIAPRSIFARKNYFYPDLPKGYQISQFELPVCQHGWLDIDGERGSKRIGITRIHMEEDAGKLLHGESPDTAQSSFVDLNRAGTPLLEIVSEPDLRSADEAVAYLKKLHQIVVYLGVCDGNLEEGSFRCDANVSIRPFGESRFGTRAEIKNVNSFRFVKQAIEYEIERQAEILGDGGTIIQETRLFDAQTGMTRSMRSKEEAHDYRYFPDPDLVPLEIDSAWVAAEKAQLPELPESRRRRYQQEWNLSEYDAEVLTAERGMADYFEACVALLPDQAKGIANWVMGELTRKLNDSGLALADNPVSPQRLIALLKLIDKGTISGKIAKTVFDVMWESGQDPERIVEERGLVQVSDSGAIESVIDAILAANLGQVEEYRGGKEKVFGFFVGQVMREMKGKANPAVVNDLLKRKLSGE